MRTVQTKFTFSILASVVCFSSYARFVISFSEILLLVTLWPLVVRKLRDTGWVHECIGISSILQFTLVPPISILRQGSRYLSTSSRLNRTILDK